MPDPTLTPDPRDIVEFSFAPAADPAGAAGASIARNRAGKPFLRLWFTCAGLYGRGYRERSGRGYLGRCPRCGACVRFGIGAGGTTARQFEVSCDGRWTNETVRR